MGGGIYLGIIGPTEAAAMAWLYAIVSVVFYRELKLTDLGASH